MGIKINVMDTFFQLVLSSALLLSGKDCVRCLSECAETNLVESATLHVMWKFSEMRFCIT
jgi:hypothetical protein